MHHLMTAQDPRDRFASYSELDLELLRSLSRLPPVAELRPEASLALSRVISRCLNADPRRRPTAQQLRTELGRLIPTGSRLFTTVTRWSPALGEVLGVAAAAFVRCLWMRTSSPGGAPADARVEGVSGHVERQRPDVPCLYCRGQGVGRNGQVCPICRGVGRW